MGLYLNQGNELFEISVNDDIYVDKSELISFTNNVLGKKNRYICVSRPRRFGKSTDAEMLAAYYDKSCDSMSLFENLKIAKNPDFEKNLNKYNVIFLNMTHVISAAGGADKLSSYINLKLLSELRKNYSEFVVDEETDLASALMEIYSGCKTGFIFIIDEWDCIFRESKDNLEAQKLYLDFLRTLFKDRVYIKLVYMTGILPVKKYGTHSALNMFTEFSMTNPQQLAKFMGFTKNEVEVLCDEYNVDFSEMKRWYDGYRFKKIGHVYNPKSVVDAIKYDEFISYWTRTETYEALRIYFDLNLDGLKDSIISMLGGVNCPINTEKFQNDMTSFKTKDDVFTLLVHLGYLGYIAETSEVFIPNMEIANEFKNAVEGSKWEEIVNALNLSNTLLEATLNFEQEKVAEIIDSVHDDIASILKYNDENSLSCVISIAYYSARNDYTLIREFPSGKGFADIVFIPRKNCDKPAMVIELKWNKSAGSAINQIKEKNYTNSLADYYGNILLVGIDYDKKKKKHECIIEQFQK